MTPSTSLLALLRGCILGGAVGDALGAPVEFMRRGKIVDQYGLEGPGELGRERMGPRYTTR